MENKWDLNPEEWEFVLGQCPKCQNYTTLRCRKPVIDEVANGECNFCRNEIVGWEWVTGEIKIAKKTSNN